MSILPNNTDPSKDYVSQNSAPPLTLNGLVYNKIYAHTGVVDSLLNTNTNGYVDPNLAIINNSNALINFDQQQNNEWFSLPNVGGSSSDPIVITYNLNSNTYYNNISLFVLNVPCYVELLDQNLNALPGQSTFSLAGGNNIYSTTDWYNLNYQAPTTQLGVASIILRITRQNAIIIYDQNGISNNISYRVGVRDFRIKLNVLSIADVPSSVVSGTDSIVSQNNFGFVENYTYSGYSSSNAFTNDTGSVFWKCAPQPTSDSIVYFYAKVSDPTPTFINRLYINPIHSSVRFNVYYTTQSTSGNTIDPGTFTWSPIPRDFILRQGIYDIPTTSCTYLKFEFTKLVPEVYDLPFDTVYRTINVFPYDVENYYTNLENNIINGNATRYSFINNANLSTQTQSSNQNVPSTVFGLASQTVAGNNSWPSIAALNSSQSNNSTTVGVGAATQITDPTVSYKLLDYYGNYNNQPYSQFLQRQFPGGSIHQYNQVVVPQTWHQAYFVGINYVTAFYENTYDDLRAIPGTLLSSNMTTSGFLDSGTNYVTLITDQVAYTPFFKTIDSFSSFNVAGLTTDWRSFLTNGASPANDPTLMNNLTSYLPDMSINSTLTDINTLGISSVYSVTQHTPNVTYGIKSALYSQPNFTNLVSYFDANFIPASGSTLNWSPGLGTTLTSTPLTISGTTLSGMTVSGGSYTAYYNFTIPNVYSTSGTTSWKLQLGSNPFGVVGYASYSPASGVNYYFLVNAQSSGTGNLVLKTQFINPTTSGVIANTLVSGSNVLVTGLNTLTVLTGTNYTTSGFPSNTIQVVVSGSVGAYQLYNLGVFNSPTTTWFSSSDRSNMRVSGVARVFLPFTNNGSYRASLIATDYSNNQYEIAFKNYSAGSMPTKTWFDIELENYTGANYARFSMQLVQSNNAVSEQFYVAMLAPFYHPIRYEFINVSGATNWTPITAGINDPTHFISTVSGLPASGIQLKMTALDPYSYISGISIIPQYKQSPFYANLQIDYLGDSKTNETESRTAIEYKPYFQLNKEVHPYNFSLNYIAPTVTKYSID